VRVGIVGYGACRFGAAFGFRGHPNIEVVAVSDLIPDRRRGLMKACRCDKSYESLEVLHKIQVPHIIEVGRPVFDATLLKICPRV
jgi:predicted dehydrogenase